MQVVIHDLDEALFRALVPLEEEAMVLTADSRYAPCRGCLKCWLKQDGYCVYTDKLQHIGGILGRGDPLWIISRNCFGGYSSAVKAVLDRAIGVSLPFFTYRGGQTHHLCRYPRRKLMQVYLYGETTTLEESAARKMVRKNGWNLGYDQEEVFFAPAVEQFWERVH